MLVRPRKRIIAGVCQALGLHYNFPINLLRIIFILLSVSTTLPLFIYFALWLIFPNHKRISDQAQLKRFQTKGLLIGGLIGAIIGFTFPFLIFDVQSVIILILISLFLIPVGAFVGYLVGKGIVEKRNSIA